MQILDATTSLFLMWSLCTIATAQVLPPPVLSPAAAINYEYDANGNLTRSIQAPGISGLESSTRLQHDTLSRLSSKTNALGGAINFEYNGGDNLTKITDPRRLVTTYDRDGHGGLMRLGSPDTGTTVYQRDAAGNILTRTDSRGVVTSLTYDGISRLSSVVHRWGSQPDHVLTYHYDETGQDSPFGRGRLTSTTYRGGSSHFVHDALGRIVRSTQSTDTGAGTTLSQTTYRQYDAAGNMIRLTYPSGRMLSIQYVAGQPVTMSLSSIDGSSAAILVSDIQFAPFGAVQRWLWQQPTGPVPHERIYDGAGRIVRQNLGGMTRDLRYDATGRLVGYLHCCGSSAATNATIQRFNQSFRYDLLGRLIQATSGAGSWLYSYDANGNRIRKLESISGSQRVFSGYTATDSNRLVVAAQTPQRTLSHDGAGNTVSDTDPQSSWVAGYDLAGRLATLNRTTAASSTASTTASLGYLYNGFGQRVVKLVSVSTACAQNAAGCTTSAPPSNAVVYVYGHQGELLGEYRASDGAALREYVWLDDIPIAVVAPEAISPGALSDVFFIHADHLNTPRVVVDQMGRQRWSWLSAEPFGASPPNGNPQGLGQFNFDLRFPGQFFDRDSGLVHNHHRDYDPTLGRYTQSDPIGLAGGINTYAHVENNPLSYADPEGLFKIYGNWCGPNWSGGQKHAYVPVAAGYYNPAVDPTDAACRRHDVGYYACRQAFPCDKQLRGQCMNQMDRRLGNEVRFNSGIASMAIYAWMNNNNIPDPGDDAPSCICTGN